MPPVTPGPGGGFPDRVRDQEVYARCLVPGTYDEGWLQEGQVFRVGHSVADEAKLIRHAFPAVRMEWFRSNGFAERVNGPEGSKTRDVEDAIKEVRSRRPQRTHREEPTDARPLSDAHGGDRP